MKSQMHLILVTPNGTENPIEVQLSDTVLDIKNRVEKSEGISISDQILIFNGHTLEDNKQMQSYKILEGSTIKLSLQSIEVNPYDSVEATKKVLQNLNEQLHIDLPQPEGYVFLYKQKPMRDEYTVRSYGVQPDDMIGMFEGSIESFIKVGMVIPRKNPDDPCCRFLLAIRLFLQYGAEGLGCSS